MTQSGNYQMPPQEGFTVAHFITVADIERSAQFYEKVFGGRILSPGGHQRCPRLHPDRQHLAHRQCRRRTHAGQTHSDAQHSCRSR